MQQKKFYPLSQRDIDCVIEQAKGDSIRLGKGYRVYRWVTCAVKTEGLDTEMCGYSTLEYGIGKNCVQIGVVSGGDFIPAK